MNILFYSWGSVCESGWIRAIKKCGDTCIVFSKKMNDYHADATFSQDFLQILHRNNIDAVVSYDYFPLLSILCEITKIPYMAWIYDCPQYTLYSDTLTNPSNYIFCFDNYLATTLEQRGAAHVYSFPLGTDVDVFSSVKSKGKVDDISFVGGLYEKAFKDIQKCQFSEYQTGFVEGIITAQQKIYGYNFIKDVVPPELTQHIVDSCQLTLSSFYHEDSAQMAADIINLEISRRERMEVLERLADKWKVTLYSNALLPDSLKQKQIQTGGYVDYETQMPTVFQSSKINLNITSKTITSGIPQRVLDIMACKGFCMTNYQPEIAEYFQDGEHLAMYGSMEELEDKIAFYLTHDTIREEIVQKGHWRTKEFFSLEKRWKDMKELAKRKREST